MEHTDDLVFRALLARLSEEDVRKATALVKAKVISPETACRLLGLPATDNPPNAMDPTLFSVGEGGAEQ